MEGIEPPTHALRKHCSTPELHQPMVVLWSKHLLFGNNIYDAELLAV
jgi:hypothetical protein